MKSKIHLREKSKKSSLIKNFISIFILFEILSLPVATGGSVVTEETQVHPNLPQTPFISKNSQECLVNEAILEDIKKAKEEIESKQREIAHRELELKSKEQALSEELVKLEKIRDLVTQTREVTLKENLDKVNKLVETLLSMSPRAASKVISSLDRKLAVAVMSQMDTSRLAKIMNLMDSNHSSQLSEDLAGGASRKKNLLSSGKPILTQSNKKGGEKYDRNSE